MTLLLVLPVMDALFPAPRPDGQLAVRALASYRLPAAHGDRSRVPRGAPRRARRHHHRRGSDRFARQSLVPITTLPLGERLGATAGQAIMTALAVVVQYARLLVWPARLSPDYWSTRFPLVTTVLDGRFIGGVALTVACVCGIVMLWRRSPSRHSGWPFSPDVLHREQLFDHDRDHLRRTPAVSAERRALSSRPE